MTFKTYAGPSHTPCGATQHKEQQAPGIVFIGTAGHGGYWLSAERLKAMRAMHGGVFAIECGDPWFEEDCGWALVALAFPESFDEKNLAAARDTVRNTFPAIHEKLTGTILKPGESYTRDDEIFRAATRYRFVPRSAWGDWEETTPKGFVKVLARREADGKEMWFLVPAEEYGQRFVVDTARHGATTPATGRSKTKEPAHA